MANKKANQAAHRNHMQRTEPEISILMAAYGLRAEITAAVGSVFAHAQAAAIEVIVASDDGTDYRDCLPADPRLVFTPIGPLPQAPPPRATVPWRWRAAASSPCWMLMTAMKGKPTAWPRR